jgi:hypothetical protein
MGRPGNFCCMKNLQKLMLYSSTRVFSKTSCDRARMPNPVLREAHRWRLGDSEGCPSLVQRLTVLEQMFTIWHFFQREQMLLGCKHMV